VIAPALIIVIYECKQNKNIDKFYRKIQSKDGLDFYCKTCCREYHRKYMQNKKHRDKQNESSRKYRKTLNGYLHEVFNSMRQRCYNKKWLRYKDWGGRGIKCLFESFDAFYDYVINDLKIDPRGLQIDRINNDDHYRKGNIRFVTAKENANNREREVHH
jgi:hypothetical protein